VKVLRNLFKNLKITYNFLLQKVNKNLPGKLLGNHVLRTSLQAKNVHIQNRRNVHFLSQNIKKTFSFTG
jgi:hypothetical protein